MPHWSYYSDWFEGYGSGKYSPDIDAIVLSTALGKPHHTRVAIGHIESFGKLDIGKSEVSNDNDIVLQTTGPYKKFVVANDIKSESSKTYDLELLIKRHLVLTHELVHRRLTMDTSYGFVLRFFGLAKAYLERNEKNLHSDELKYLRILKFKYEYLISNWQALHEYIADYSTLLEIDYLITMATSDHKIGHCDCTIQDFEEHLGDLSSISRDEIIEFLKGYRSKLGRANLGDISAFKIGSVLKNATLSPLLTQQAIKLDFVKLYFLIYLSSCFPFSEFNFALCSPSDLVSKTTYYLPGNLIKTYLKISEGVHLDKILSVAPIMLFSDDKEALWKMNPAFGRADFFTRKKCKIDYRHKILEARNKLKFSFFDYAQENLRFYDERAIIDPIPDFSTARHIGVREVFNVVFLNREDHFTLTKQHVKDLHNTDIAISEQLFDEYFVNLIYYGLFSSSDYNSNSELGKLHFLSDGQYIFSEIITGGHDVGSILNMLLCRK